MTELQQRLGSMMHPEQTGKVTPARIQRFEEGETEWTGADVLNNLPFEVIMERFTSHHGNPKLDQRRRFEHDARRLLTAGYKASQLIQMDETCINRNGTINEEALEEFLKTGHGELTDDEI